MEINLFCHFSPPEVVTYLNKYTFISYKDAGAENPISGSVIQENAKQYPTGFGDRLMIFTLLMAKRYFNDQCHVISDVKTEQLLRDYSPRDRVKAMSCLCCL